MNDYWLLMMRKTMRIGGGNHLWHDWHIVKIIDTINTSLWGLTSWLTHHKDYWYNQHLIMRTNLENDWHIKIIDTINTSLWRLTLRMGGGEPDEESVRIRGTWDSFEAIFILFFKNMANQPWWAFGNGQACFIWYSIQFALLSMLGASSTNTEQIFFSIWEKGGRVSPNLIWPKWPDTQSEQSERCPSIFLIRTQLVVTILIIGHPRQTIL